MASEREMQRAEILFGELQKQGKCGLINRDDICEKLGWANPDYVTAALAILRNQKRITTEPFGGVRFVILEK